MSFIKILSDANYKALKTETEHDDVAIRVMSLPCGLTCHFAGLCFLGCYATKGHQGMPSCRRAYMENLTMVHDGTFFPQLDAELTLFGLWASRNDKTPYVRLHDSGDFDSEEYLDNWLDVMRKHEGIHFYAYTKCVQWIKDRADRLPDNFTVILSYGGTQDGLIDPSKDRHAHVILKDADVPDGYTDASESEWPAMNPDVKNIAIHYHGNKKGVFNTL